MKILSLQHGLAINCDRHTCIFIFVVVRSVLVSLSLKEKSIKMFRQYLKVYTVWAGRTFKCKKDHT